MYSLSLLPMATSRKRRAEFLSLEKLRDIVEKHLPAWFTACSSDTEAIVMHEAAFGTSRGELLLFACAIKYAAHKGKTVHVTCGKGDRRRTPESVFPASSMIEIHREADKD